MKIIRKIWNAAGLPCWQCGGKGYVVDSDVARFIERNGLALYQAADTLMANEIDYGALGSLPVDAWERLGLPPDEAMEFATEVAHVHKLHACNVCKGQEDHPAALEAATDVIRSLRANDRRRRAEWQATVTPEGLRNRMRRKMDVAIRYAQQKPVTSAVEGDLADLGDWP